jgi:flagellar biosynthesis protein FliQ
MGYGVIDMSGTFLNNIFGALFSPVQTFEEIQKQDSPPVFEGFITVVLVSIIGAIMQFDSKSLFFLGTTVITYVIVALISWIFVASIIDAVASIFCQQQKYDQLLVMTALALVPWVLMAPINLFKSIGFIGSLIAIPIEIAIWIWTALLFLLAVAKVYQLSGGKVIVLSIMPFLASIVALSWMTGFVSNIIHIVAT